MMTKKQARNIANWMFHESCINTDGGSWITYFEEIEERYGIKMDEKSAKQIEETVRMLYPDAILDVFIDEESIELMIGTWYYENDEEDDEDEREVKTA